VLKYTQAGPQHGKNKNNARPCLEIKWLSASLPLRLAKCCSSHVVPRRRGVRVAEPLLKREGNVRLVTRTLRGYPDDVLGVVAEVRAQLATTALVPYGPATVLMTLPPDEQPCSAWECQVGCAVTGQPVRIANLAVEDYRALYALSLPHSGPIRQLAQTYAKLAAHATSMSYRVRPYWRVALRARRLADGNLLPVCDVAVFIDK
jgi:hypothetical protein